MQEGIGAMTLSPAQFAIVLALTEGEMHGYAIMQQARSSGTAPRMGPGTLYRSISQLLGAGLIIEAGDRAGSETDEQRRRYYGLTDTGHVAARSEASRLADLVSQARLRGLLPGVGGSPAAATQVLRGTS